MCIYISISICRASLCLRKARLAVGAGIKLAELANLLLVGVRFAHFARQLAATRRIHNGRVFKQIKHTQRGT